MFECGTLRTWSAVQLWAKVVVLYDIVIVTVALSRYAELCNKHVCVCAVPVHYNPGFQNHENFGFEKLLSKDHDDRLFIMS